MHILAESNCFALASIALAPPCRAASVAFKFAASQVAVEKGGDAFSFVDRKFHLFFAKITDTHLDQFLHFRDIH